MKSADPLGGDLGETASYFVGFSWQHVTIASCIIEEDQRYRFAAEQKIHDVF